MDEWCKIKIYLIEETGLIKTVLIATRISDITNTRDAVIPWLSSQFWVIKIKHEQLKAARRSDGTENNSARERVPPVKTRFGTKGCQNAKSNHWHFSESEYIDYNIFHEMTLWEHENILSWLVQLQTIKMRQIYT